MTRRIGWKTCLVACLGSGVAAWGQAPKHVMFTFVDRFENPQAPCIAESVLRAWEQDWVTLAFRHTDADGRHPVHDCFLIQDASKPKTAWACVETVLPRLSRVAYQSCGEVNLNLHHPSAYVSSFHQDARSETLFASVMRDTVAAFNARGALLVADVVPRRAFAFIHGDGALDNSRDPISPDSQFCSVNREIRYLHQLGCYVDATFPAGYAESEPLIRDSIFYIRDDAARASYRNPDNVRAVEVNQRAWGDLMAVEGPDTFTSIDPDPPAEGHTATLARMQEWVGHNVHVVGRDDWVFVKVDTRGASYGDLTPGSPEWDVFFGPVMEQFFSDIERVYNDGVNWKLHYVSMREMYNIIKAAEAGLAGDPGQYRDYAIPPYANQRILSPNRYRLHTYNTSMAVLEKLDTDASVEFSFRQFGTSSVVEECTRINGWRWEFPSNQGSNCAATDAVKSPGQFGELHFVDNTPSQYYRIRRGP